MKVAVSGGHVGLIVDGRFVDTAAAASGTVSGDPARLYEEWDALRALAASITDASAHPVVDESALELPGPPPRQAFGVGLNYNDHAAESAMALPPVPLVFIKAPSAIVGPNEPVAVGSATVDWEAELTVVIGRDCRNVSRADAWSVVAGLTIGQDISDRAIQFEAGANPQFGVGKSAPGFGPIGPWIVSIDEFDEAPALTIRCGINGETKQDSDTKHLIFDVPTLIEFLSARVQLCAGDVIFTGTPAGVGWGRDPKEFLAPGDVITSTVEGIGTLTTRMVGA